MRLLLAETDRQLADALLHALREQSYAVDVAHSSRVAEQLLFVNCYDLVILDTNIVSTGCAELPGYLRARDDATPLIMLTARQSSAGRVACLDMGADDCLSLPFAVTELLARVRSVMRRSFVPLRNTLRVADVTMDRNAHCVKVCGNEIDLTPKEYSVLEYFLLRPGVVVTRTELIEHSWDNSFESMSNVVDVTIHRLRGKIEAGRERSLLTTVKGVGYVLQEQMNCVDQT